MTDKLEPGWHWAQWRKGGAWERVHIRDWGRLMLAYSKEFPPGRVPGTDMEMPFRVRPRLTPPSSEE